MTSWLGRQERFVDAAAPALHFRASNCRRRPPSERQAGRGSGPSECKRRGGGSRAVECWPSVRSGASRPRADRDEVGALLGGRPFVSLGELNPGAVHVQGQHGKPRRTGIAANPT